MRDLRHICEGIFDEQEHELELHTLANLQKLKNFEKDIEVNLIDYTVMRPWNKKAIQQKSGRII